MRVSKTSYICVLIFVVVRSSAWGDDLEAPLPFNIEHTASPACINRLNQYHTILSAFFNGVPAASTMKRNDIVVPFIQTDSVFSPLSAGKKVVKYQAVGSYIRTPDRKYYSSVETDTNEIDVNLRWRRESDFNVSLNASYENLCSESPIGLPHIGVWGSDSVKKIDFSLVLLSAYAETMAGDNNHPAISLADFCQDPNATFASRVQTATVRAYRYDSTTVITTQDREDFRTKVLAQIKPGATVSTLCDAWGY